jgi:ubiquinol-cytochrome c reductase cytochrome c subunit
MRRAGLTLAALLLLVLTSAAGLAATRGNAKADDAMRGGKDDEPESELVAEGEDLFLTSCAACHGAGGVGTDQGPTLIGVGAAAADFQLSTGRMPLTNPDELPQSKRPAFPDDEIDALVAYVASLGDGPAIPDPTDPPGDLVEGGQLYLLNCQACHSAAGNGGALSSGRNAPTLHGASEVQIAEAMRTGPGPMPVFGPDTLSDQQVNDIVRYVRYLDDPADPGGFSLGRVGPVTEGLVALLFGLVVLAFLCRWIEPKEKESS